MSYILDALKKSRAEEAAGGVALSMQPSAKTKSRPKGLLGLVIVLVLTNVGLLIWVSLPKPTTRPASVLPPVQTTPADPAKTQPTSNTAPAEAQSAPPQPIQQAVQTPQRKIPVRKIALSDLPSDEQTRFNSFSYSTHIFTDDPSLCAIVIDGQRLSAGDSFEGMEVVAITEEGVVFGTQMESTSGRTENLHVAVSVMQQWDS